MSEYEDKPQTEPILHPCSLGAMVLFALNDHYLKYAHTSWLTGKLSDFAGLIFFPLLLELLVKTRQWAVLLTGMGFAMVKLTTVGNQWYNQFYQAFFDLFGWGEMVPLVMDATDCWALMALWIPLQWIPSMDRR